MDFINALRGLKKSHSGPNLSFSERISLSRRSANHGKHHRDGLSSPLPPRPPSRNGNNNNAAAGGGNKAGGYRVIEKIPENRVVDSRTAATVGGGHSATYVTPQELRIQDGAAVCPSCRVAFDESKRRRLVDSCGHERCYSCLIQSEACPLCLPNVQSYHHQSTRSLYTRPSSRPQSPALSRPTAQMSSLESSAAASVLGGGGGPSVDCMYGSVTGLGSARNSMTPPPVRRNMYNPSPGGHRRNWIQRHSRRPQTVNIDENTMSGDDASSTSSSRPPHHASYRAQTPRACSTQPSSLGQESGFQSTSSLLSLGAPPSKLNTSPLSTLSGSVTDHTDGLQLSHHHRGPASESGTESLASLASYCSNSSYFQQPPPGRRYSLSSRLGGGEGSGGGSRLQLAGRRSARLPGLKESVLPSKVPFVQYRPVQWFLKPLFFEVPQRSSSSCGQQLFVGRQWLYREIHDMLTSDLPTNRGVVVSGSPGSGKTAIILHLVEQSSFGKGEGILQEPLYAGRQRQQQQPVGVSSRTASTLSLAHQQQQQQLTSLASHVVAYHFCQADNAPTCGVAEWVHSLAAQLSQAPQLAAYHQILSTDHELRSRLSLVHCMSDPEAALLEGILRPLTALQRAGRLTSTPALILLDGLCEAELHRPDYGDTIAGLLARHLPSFPPWLKVVCTLRTAAKQAVRSLPFHNISLDNYDVDERLQKDIGDYIGARMARSRAIQTNVTPTPTAAATATAPQSSDGGGGDQSPTGRFQRHLLSLARGSFLFVTLTLDLIERGHIVAKSSSYKVLPQTLGEIFLLEFNLRFASASSYRQVSDILAVCLAALQPLTLPQIYQAVAALAVESGNGCGMSWAEFVARYQLLSGLLVQRRDDSICLFHPLLREWLIRRGETEPSKFLVDPRVGHAGLAMALSRLEQQLPPERTLELGHHVLKAHLYRNYQGPVPARDLQSSWLSLVSDDVSSSLGSDRNLFNPNLNVSRLLLLAGASPDYLTTYLQASPLICLFAHRGYTEMLSLLLEFGADVNRRNAEDTNAVAFAAAAGHLEALRLLVTHGGHVNHVDRTESCSLVLAARHGHLPIVEYLVACDWETSPSSAAGSTSTRIGLREAAQQAAVGASAAGHLDILEFLLDMADGVRINSADTLLGETPLGAAAAAGRRDCCHILLRRGASVAATNLKEASPLHLAAREGHWSVCELLLTEGSGGAANLLEQQDGAGRTPLILAAMEGHTGVVEYFVTGRHAALGHQDKEGLTPLAWAAARGRLEIVKFLLNINNTTNNPTTITSTCDINGVDKKGRTALDLAAQAGDPAIVSLLLERGAMMEHVDISGMRALDRAISCRHLGVVQCFLKKGAKLGPNTWAMATGKPEILLALLNKLLEDGNTLYKRGKLADAALRYAYAIKRLPPPPHQKVFDQLRLHLMLNLSRCKRKLKAYSEAIDLATEIIAAFPHAFEAYHARAKAHHAAGRVEAAYSDLTAAVRLAPQNRELHRILVSLKEEMATVSPLPSDSGFEDGGGRRGILKGDCSGGGGGESRDSTTSSSSGVGSDSSAKDEPRLTVMV